MKTKAALLVVAIAALALAVPALAAAGTAKSAAASASVSSSPGAISPDVLPCPCDGGGGSGNPNGSQHCFATWDVVGCQLDHNTSKEVVVDAASGASATAAGVICGVFSDGGLAVYCGTAVALVTADILYRIDVMPYGDCLEVGYGLIPFYNEGPYAEVIPCAAE